MKRKILVILVTAMLLLLTACSVNGQNGNGSNEDGQGESAQSSPIMKVGEDVSKESQVSEGLTLLCDESSSFSNHFGTENGFYYFTESDTITDNLAGMHLMYVDYATKKEVYLCSDSGCQHDSETCSSVFAQGEFGIDSLPFVWGNYLYVLNRDYDDDGSITINLMEGGVSPEVEASAVTLWQMNLDGSERQKIYSFPDNATAEKLVFGEGDYLWFVTKQLETQDDQGESYTTSTDRVLAKYSILNHEIVDTISLDFGDGIYQSVIGGCDHTFVLHGVAYPEGMSEADMMKLSDEECKELYRNSNTVYSTVDVNSKDKKEIYRMDNEALRSTCAVKGGYLFASDCAGGGIMKIDLSTEEQTKFADLKQNYIYFALEDTLCCCDPGATDDKTLYFVDMKTGEVHHSTLTNQSLGWPLDVLADTSSHALVVYDYDATSHGDGSYTINQYKYALISKDDLYNSQANYEPIVMEGDGR